MLKAKSVLLGTILLLIINTFVNAQTKKYTISGYVEDAQTGEKLIGASVYDQNKLKGTTTNVYGFFSLTLDEGDVFFHVSYVGYNTFQQKIDLKSNISINASLSPMEIDEVKVMATKIEKIHERNQMGAVQLQMKDVEKLPAFFGEKDIIKTIQLTPGVQSGGEGTSGLYVRGGGPDQNLILLDGVPVYNVNHLFGFFSVFNSSAINSVEIIKGGFPARYGGRTSSVLDIRMKEGNRKKLTGEGSIGLISSKFTLEGPIKKDTTSFIISARRTYIDILAKPMVVAANNRDPYYKSSGGYYFYDFNAKVNHRLSDRSKIFLSTYMGKDKMYFKSKSRNYNIEKSSDEAYLDWGNITTALRYNYQLTNKLFVNFTGTYSRYQFNVGMKYETSYKDISGKRINNNFKINYLSGIYDLGGKVDFDYLPAPNHYVRFGINETFHTFTPGVFTFSEKYNNSSSDTSMGANIIKAHEISAYIEDDIKIGERFKINPGVYISSFLLKINNYYNIEPRISLNYILRENLSVKASYSRMAQYIHLLTNGTIGLPTDLWVPVTDTIPPMKTNQYSVGFGYTLGNDYELSIEAYYKEMKNLIEYKDGASFFGNAENWQKKVELGKGESYGLEFFLQKKIGRTSGWIGYTLAWTNRKFTNLNFGNTFPYRYDRRHDISFVVVHDFDKKESKKWKKDVGLTWVYGTGNAVSLPTSTYRPAKTEPIDPNYLFNNEVNKEYYGYYEYNNDYDALEHIESKNNFREPAYHRMDLSLTLSRKQNKTERIWNFSLYNAYNRQNPFYLYFGYDYSYYNNESQKFLKQVSIFPLLPSFSYTIKF